MGRIVEIATSGIDEFLQGLGGDAFGGSSTMGLRVPTLATTSPANRYLFNLASFSIGESTKARLLGYRQYVTLGKNVGSSDAPRFVEMPVENPGFRLPDGNVTFHLQRLGGPNSQGFPKPADPTQLRSFARNWTDGPALLFRDYTIGAGDAFYPNLSAYTPPNGGRPWGEPLRNGVQGTIYDLRTQQRTHGAWSSLDVALEGPCTVALFASVWQSAGASGPPGIETVADLPNAMQEEQFLVAFPGAIYWRVGGALIVDVDGRPTRENT